MRLFMLDAITLKTLRTPGRKLNSVLSTCTHTHTHTHALTLTRVCMYVCMRVLKRTCIQNWSAPPHPDPGPLASVPADQIKSTCCCRRCRHAYKQVEEKIKHRPLDTAALIACQIEWTDPYYRCSGSIPTHTCN